MVLFLQRQYQGLAQERNGQALRQNIPAPYGGLNTRDAESAMEPTDAVDMINWIPSRGSVITRKGYEEYVSGLNGQVETLVEYNAGPVRKFLCANADEINDITNSASISNLGSGFSNARWQWVNFNANLLLFNGSDTPQKFDGTTLSANTITGPTPTNLIGVNIHKNRIYVWEDESQSFWYGATNAISGAFTEFDLSGVTPFGGNIVSMTTWNHDGGDGVDDYAIFLLSSGDVLLYDGSNPGDATNWSLIGVFKIGSPISIRGIAKIAGDVAIITDQDFVFFSQVFKAGGAVLSQSKLSGAAIDSVQKYRNNYGWEIVLYPQASSGSWLLFNVPVATNVTYKQYGINTITGASFELNGMNARCWGLFNNKLYFGDSGRVMLADSGLNDDGDFINCDIQASYTDLGTPSEKIVNSFRNSIKVDGNVVLNTTVSFDYGSRSTTQDVSSVSNGTPWGSPWGSPWSPQSSTRSELVISSGEGVALGMRIRTSLKGQQLFWYRTDYSVNVTNII